MVDVAPLRENDAVAIIISFHTLPRLGLVVRPAANRLKRTVLAARRPRVWKRGQVAQVVERSPEKAGVGGSTPSLATMFSTICIRPNPVSVPFCSQKFSGHAGVCLTQPFQVACVVS